MQPAGSTRTYEICSAISIGRKERDVNIEGNEAKASRQAIDTRGLRAGDIVRNFKREGVSDGSQRYLYRILAFARHTETDEDLVVYEALYPPFGTWVRPASLFFSEVNHEKYPQAMARWRFDHATPEDLAELGR